jgi:hypothetical protein
MGPAENLKLNIVSLAARFSILPKAPDETVIFFWCVAAVFCRAPVRREPATARQTA